LLRWPGSSRNSTTCQTPVSVQSAHVNATDFPEPKVPSAEEAQRASLLARVRSRVRRHHWPVVAAAARVHRCSRTSTRPGYRAPLSRAFRGPHALPRLLQMFCFHEHDHGPLEHPRPPNPWLGRLPTRMKASFQSRATAGGTQGQGSRKNRISTFPIVIAHDGDFAPTPIAPGTSCREHRPSPCPERRGGESGIANIAPACTAGTTRGSCDA
jgi:hypothetical protein